MLTGLLAVLAVLTVRSRFDDPDMWWHLKMGEIIWKTHTIPRIDLFSYTTGGHAYIPHEWLSQLCIYSAFKFAGYSGLMAWLCLFSSAILITGYILCCQYSKNAKVAFLGAIMIWLFATVGFAVRPQMIGYLFLIIELLLLHVGRTRDPRWFLALPLLFATWVNSHGSFFFGLCLAGVVLCSSFFHFRFAYLVSPQWDARARNMFAVAIVLSVAALFLNPIGIGQILYPVDMFLHQPINIGNVDEWHTLRFDDFRTVAFLGILLCIAVIVPARRARLSVDELLMLVLGGWLAASHERMLFVFGILVAPILSRLLSNEWDGYSIEQDRPMPNLIVLASSALTIFLAFPNRPLLTDQVDANSPVKAVEFMKANRLSGRMLNEYVYGGYLIWATPENPVFVDGRADIFEATGVLGDLLNWATLQSDPNELLRKYRIDFCVLARQSPMATVMPLLHWNKIYSDDNSVIFRRPENQE